MTAEESMDVNLGEVVRRQDRMETRMDAGFQALGDKVERLTSGFVPAAVYAADRSADQERIRRVEGDLAQAEQRGHQARWSLILAGLGLPLSVAASVLAAQLTK